MVLTVQVSMQCTDFLPGSQIPMEACVFDEVQVAADPSVEDITVFLAGMNLFVTLTPYTRIRD